MRRARVPVALVLAVLGAVPAAARTERPRVDVGGWLATDLTVFRRSEAGYGPSWNSGLDLRAARLTTRAALPGGWRARLDFELSAADPWVQEAWIEHGLGPVAIRAGRVRVPFGRAQQSALPDLHLPEMPIVAGNARDANDIGVVAAARLGRVSLQLGAVSGSRDIAVDVNETPDAAARVVTNLGPWVEIGASGSWGEGPTRHGFRGRLPCGWTFVDPPTIRGLGVRGSADLAVLTPRFGVVLEGQTLWAERDGDLGAVADLDPWRVWGVYLEAWGLVAGEPGRRGLELSVRLETVADLGDGSRVVAGEEHAPLPDTWVEVGTVGLGMNLGHGARIGLAWQIARFGHASESPDGRSPFQSFFARIQLAVTP